MGVSRFELPAGGVAAGWVCVAQRVPVTDPWLVRVRGRRFGALAAELRRSSAVLLSGAGSGLWRGAAQQACAERLRCQAPPLAAAADRYDGYAAALAGYAAVLDEAVPRLRWLRRELTDRLAAAAAAAAAAPGAAVVAEPRSAELLGYAREFKGCYDRWADAVDRCAGTLRRAGPAGPAGAGHRLSGWLHELDHGLKYLLPVQYLALHPSLKNASDCLGILSSELSAAGLALLFICPPAAGICLGVAAALSAAQFGVDLARRQHGEQVGTAALGLDAMAAIPVGGRAALGVRGAAEAAQALHDLGPVTRAATRLVPGGGLAAHEAAGGHALTKHVGKDSQYLTDRLAAEPDLKMASTFYDHDVAETAISDLLDSSDARIQRWLAGRGADLVLRGTAAESIGLLLRRGADEATSGRGLKVVLRRSSALKIGYVLVTAMVTE